MEQKNTEKPKTAVVAFGRFQPPTRGHEKLIRHVSALAAKHGASHYVFPSPSHGDERNPLSHDRKVHYMKKMFPGTNVVHDKTIRSPLHALKQLSDKGYKHIHFVVGGDRTDEFQKVIHKYIKHPDKTKSLEFDKFHVHEIGKRDEKSDTVSGISGSKMRNFVKNGDYKSFRSNLPSKTKDHHAKALWKDLGGS
jgi:nicotinic acid mononucleotide adenylyltransferase